MKLSKFLLTGLALMAFVLTGCSGEDGEQGIQGPAGPPGESTNGADGDDGEDGNANVAEYVIVIDPAVGKESLSYKLPQLTQEVIDEDAILFYFQRSVGDEFIYTLVPGLSYNGDYMIGVNVSLGLAEFFFRDFDGNPFALPDNAEISSIKMIIIESSNTGNVINNDAKGSKQADVLSHLKEQGIDVSDYNSVASYYGLN